MIVTQTISSITEIAFVTVAKLLLDHLGQCGPKTK
jgi:hypothetical protein